MSGGVRHTCDRLTSVIPHHVKREAIFGVQLLNKINNAHPSLDFDIDVLLVRVVQSRPGCRCDKLFQARHF